MFRLFKIFRPMKKEEPKRQESIVEKMEREADEKSKKYDETKGNESYILENDFLPNPPDHFKKALEKLGVEFLGSVEGDQLFQKTKLPQGWKKVKTDDYRFFNLFDDKDRLIAEIGYIAYPIGKRSARIILKVPW